jgi:hypothetical protein
MAKRLAPKNEGDRELAVFPVLADREKLPLSPKNESN